MKPKIFIGIPNLGTIGTGLAFRVRDWYHNGHLQGKYDITVMEATGIRPLEIAFNVLHKLFLESDCDYFFTINDDEHLPSDAIDRLLAHDVDVVIPLGLRWDRKFGPMPCVGVREGGEHVAGELAKQFDNPTDITATEPPARYVQPTTGFKGLRPCDRVGNSGILIKRHVMETIPVGTFRLNMSEDRTEVLATEDYILCDAIRAAGFEIFVDCTLVLDHYKQVNLQTVKQLMVTERLTGQGDTARALESQLAAGATPAEAVKGIQLWFTARQKEVFPEGS